MIIHETSFTYASLPSVMPLLNSVIFMWFVIGFTVALLAWVAMKLWNIHSIPKHLAEEQGLTQARLVFWLCMLGIIWKPLWILAVVAIVTDWQQVQNWLRGVKS